jgi:hypothetical protein
MSQDESGAHAFSAAPALDSSHDHGLVEFVVDFPTMEPTEASTLPAKAPPTTPTMSSVSPTHGRPDAVIVGGGSAGEGLHGSCDTPTRANGRSGTRQRSSASSPMMSDGQMGLDGAPRPYVYHKPGGTFRVHDVSQHGAVPQCITVSEEGTVMTSAVKRSSTVYSAEVFSGADDVTATVVVSDVGRGVVAFGVLPPQHISATATSVLGERQIRGSVAVVLSAGRAVVMHKDAVVGSHAVPRAPAGDDAVTQTTRLTLRIAAGRISFAVDGCAVEAEECDAFDVSRRMLRLGVSLSAVGQRAEFSDDHGGPAAAADEQRQSATPEAPQPTTHDSPTAPAEEPAAAIATEAPRAASPKGGQPRAERRGVSRWFSCCAADPGSDGDA